MDIVDKEYERNNELKRENVKQLLNWLKTQPHLPHMIEQEVIWFLSACHGNNELAKVKIDNYYSIRTAEQEVFRPRTNEEIRFVCDRMLCYPLSRKTPKGETIMFVRTTDKDATNYVFADHCNHVDMFVTLNYLVNGFGNGLQFIIDVQNLSMSHAVRVDFMVCKKVMEYYQQGMPLRFKGIHFLPTRSYLDMFITSCKRFLKKDFSQKVHCHRNVDDLTKLIPLEFLPRDYGGKEESLDVLKEKMIQMLHDNTDYIKHRNKQFVDESKRPEKSKRYSGIFGVDGTFKKLQID